MRLFVVAMFIPYQIQLGPLLMSAPRFVLLVLFVPLMVRWVAGAADGVRRADVALLLMCVWVAISLWVVHDLAFAAEPSGIMLVETMGAYLLARVYIRDAAAFERMVRWVFGFIVILLPFALIEALTARNVLLELANSVMFSVDDVYKDPRWGLDRVQGPFEHPIHFGVFTGAFVALAYYVLGYGRPLMGKAWRAGIVVLTSFLSLSSGPLTAVIAQLMVIGWDRALAALRGRWTLLAVGAVVAVVLLEIASNRSVPHLFIDYFSFNARTAYNRLQIWEFGTASIANYPMFGVGFNEWARPSWMSGSMDMFWLVPAVQNGLPAALLLQIAVLSLFVRVVRHRPLDDRVEQYKMGFLVCLFGLYMVGWTVHLWKVMYVLFMFLLGSGAWILKTPLRAGREPGPR